MRSHSITNPLTPEEQRAGLRDDPAGLTFEDLAYWIDALDSDLNALDELARPADLVARLALLRYEMDVIRAAKRPVVEPVDVRAHDTTYHVGGLLCDEGQTLNGVLAITSHHQPYMVETAIVVGSPSKTPLLSAPARLPKINGWSMSVATAKRMVATLQQAIRDVETAAPAKPQG